MNSGVTYVTTITTLCEEMPIAVPCSARPCPRNGYPSTDSWPESKYMGIDAQVSVFLIVSAAPISREIGSRLLLSLRFKAMSRFLIV